MSLLLRINLALAAAFALAAVALAWACASVLAANARQEALREAGLMMESARVMRAYTAEQIVPLLQGRLGAEFLPQSIPSYAATESFLKLRERHPEYEYREATLNPTNLRDRATDWEADLIQQFRNHPQSAELVGERASAMGPTLYLARPIRAEPQCLSCHSVPAAAPASLLARYGASNGFGWQPHEVVAAQVVSVPLANAEANAARLERRVVSAVALILALALLIVNVVLYFAVVRPVRLLARAADQVSLGDMSGGEFAARGSSETVELARAFNRMRTSLAKALRLLEPRA